MLIFKINYKNNLLENNKKNNENKSKNPYLK